MSFRTSGCFERNFVTGRLHNFLKFTDATCSMLDDGLFKGGQYIAQIAGQQKLSNGFADGRGIVSAVRVIPALHQLISGKVFLETDQNGLFLRTQDPSNNQKPRFLVCKSFLDVLLGVLIVAGRILSPISWLNGLKVIDLGKNSHYLGKASLGIWGTVSVLSAGKAIHAWALTPPDAKELGKKRWEAIQGILDTAALPGDFNIGSSIPAVAVFNVAANVASAVSNVAYGIVYS